MENKVYIIDPEKTPPLDVALEEAEKYIIELKLEHVVRFASLVHYAKIESVIINTNKHV